jgi:hypothetical protein
MLQASKGAGDAASVAAGDSFPSTTLMVRGPNTESSALCAMLVPTPQPIPEPQQKLTIQIRYCAISQRKTWQTSCIFGTL